VPCANIKLPPPPPPINFRKWILGVSTNKSVATGHTVDFTSHICVRYQVLLAAFCKAAGANTFFSLCFSLLFDSYYVLFCRPRWSSGQRACHWTQDSRVQTRQKAIEIRRKSFTRFYGLLKIPSRYGKDTLQGKIRHSSVMLGASKMYDSMFRRLPPLPVVCLLCPALNTKRSLRTLVHQPKKYCYHCSRFPLQLT
jgi:hypothetical protein